MILVVGNVRAARTRVVGADDVVLEVRMVDHAAGVDDRDGNGTRCTGVGPSLRDVPGIICTDDVEAPLLARARVVEMRSLGR